MPSRRRQRGGSINTPLSPTPITGEIPTLFSSNEAKVAGHGCAGTRLATKAAEGKYVPYGQTGGGVCLGKTPLTARAGPNSGYASIKPCGNMVAERSLGMGAGVVGEVGQGAHANDLTGALYSGGRRLSRSKRSRRRHVGRKSRGRKSRGRKSRRHKSRRHKSRRHKYCRHKSRGRKSRSLVSIVRGALGGRSRKQRGGSGHSRSGYTQLLSDTAYSQGYSAGGIPLHADESSLANPSPHTAYAQCTE